MREKEKIRRSISELSPTTAYGQNIYIYAGIAVFLSKSTREGALAQVSCSLKDLLGFQNFARCIVPASAHNHCLFELWLAATVPAAEGSVPRNSVLHVVLAFPDPCMPEFESTVFHFIRSRQCYES